MENSKDLHEKYFVAIHKISEGYIILKALHLDIIKRGDENSKRELLPYVQQVIDELEATRLAGGR